MEKSTITITATVKDRTFPTMVVDISPDGVSVNYPKGSGIEVETLPGGSHVELRFRLPDTDEVFHFLCRNWPVSDTYREIESGLDSLVQCGPYLVQGGEIAFRH